MTVFSEGISDLCNPLPAQYHSEYQLKSCQDMQRRVMQMWCERQKQKNSNNKSSKSLLQQCLQYMQLKNDDGKNKSPIQPLLIYKNICMSALWKPLHLYMD